MRIVILERLPAGAGQITSFSKQARWMAEVVQPQIFFFF